MAMLPERRLPRPLDAEALDRLALRYVERFATTRGKLADYLRRGLGARRVGAALRQAHVVAEAEALAPAIQARALAAALVFARRRRIGPFGRPAEDRGVRERQLAAMLRAGHPLDLSRRIVAARDLSEVEGADEVDPGALVP